MAYSPSRMTFVEEADPADLVRDVQWLVRELPLFRDLDPALLDALSDVIEWLALPGGMTLFEDGDLPDALYFVVNGTLGAYQTTPDGYRRLVGRITSGETVGGLVAL